MPLTRMTLKKMMRMRMTAKRKKTTTLRVPTTAIQSEHNFQPGLLPNCSILHIPDPGFCSTFADAYVARASACKTAKEQ